MPSSWSFPYGTTASIPYWGKQTSHVNFCEEDYIVTHLVAEFINTVTSLAYIGYGIHGIRRLKKEAESLFAAANLPYFGLIGVGIFSGIYHSTMKYHTQMADEMSMHLAMGCVLIRLFTYQQPPHIQRRNATIIVVGLASFVTYHCLTDEFILHVVLFFCLSVLVGQMVRKIIRETITDPAAKQRLSGLTTLATCTALFAYGLWNIDVNFCDTLTRWKRQLGMPWGILLELHGWWHILTAIAAYIFIALVEFLTCPVDDETHGVGFAWPAKAVLADLVPKKVVESNGVRAAVKGGMNGHAQAKRSA